MQLKVKVTPKQNCFTSREFGDAQLDMTDEFILSRNQMLEQLTNLYVSRIC